MKASIVVGVVVGVVLLKRFGLSVDWEQRIAAMPDMHPRNGSSRTSRRSAREQLVRDRVARLVAEDELR